MDAGAQQSREERALVEGLRNRDEAVFIELVDTLSPSLLRVAREYVRDDQVAREVLQETWLGVIKGIDRFEGRSTVKTWVFRILMNIARTRGKVEARSAPFSSLASGDDEGPPWTPTGSSRRTPTGRPTTGRSSPRCGARRRSSCSMGRRTA